MAQMYPQLPEKVALKSDVENEQPDIQSEVVQKQMDRLNFLDTMDEIVVQQPVRGKEWLLQTCCCWEVKNEYRAFRCVCNMKYELQSTIYHLHSTAD